MRLVRLLTPSLADFLFLAVFFWLLFFTISSPQGGLLGDSDTGYHIRTGDYVLSHGDVPRVDIFSFTREGEPWFAWEWLSGVLFSLAHQAAGMRGVIVLSAAVLALANLVLLRHMVWRGANFLVVIAMLHFAIGASSVHYLARPHIFTLLLFAISWFVLDVDRSRPTRWVWVLVPLSVLWVNLHGGFLALLVTLAILSAGSWLEWRFGQVKLGSRFQQAGRYAILFVACLAATLLNPYGYRVHQHAIDFLRQPWIRELVFEFQSPKFSSGESGYFEIMLIGGILCAAWLISKRQYASALLTIAWAHAGLTSVRHVSVYAFVVTPLLASAVMVMWNRWTSDAQRNSLAGILDSIGREHTRHLSHSSVWPVLVVAALFWTPLGLPFPQGFPPAMYPVDLISKHEDLLVNKRVFTTDEWADFLTYKYYPEHRVFFDSRTDFYGEEFSRQYLRILNGNYGWKDGLEKQRVEAVLIPTDSALSSLLSLDAAWRRVEIDGQAVLFERIPKY